MFRKGKFNMGFRCPNYLTLVIAVFMAVGMLGCASQQIQMPAVSPVATDEYHLGKFVWYDLYTDDLESVSRFYNQLFGWTFQDTQPGISAVKTVLADGTPIASAIYTKPLEKDVKESRWLGYISVDDVDRVCEDIKQKEGSVYLNPKEIPGRGRVAIIIDSEGAIFGAIRAEGGDPADTDGVMENSWLGSELWTRNMDDAFSFYHTVAGYQKTAVELGAGKTYTFLTGDDERRAGIVQIEWDGVEPDWLPYIAVTDVAAVVEKARSLNGSILVDPDMSQTEGRVAIIADPSGAIFAIQERPTMIAQEGQ